MKPLQFTIATLMAIVAVIAVLTYMALTRRPGFSSGTFPCSPRPWSFAIAARSRGITGRSRQSRSSSAWLASGCSHLSSRCGWF